jgi:hypothetical protein
MTEPSTAVRTESEAAAEERRDHDFSDQKKPRLLMKEHDDAPVGALKWDGQTASKMLRQWRRACFWRWRRGLLVRSLTVLLPDYAATAGYAWVGNTALARECWTSTTKVDRTLTKMIAGQALIRVYAVGFGDKPIRRLYLAKSVVDEFDKGIIENR